MAAFERGDQVTILVGGPHENYGKQATVSRVTSCGDNILVFFGDQDEDEWVYGPEELEKVG